MTRHAVPLLLTLTLVVAGAACDGGGATAGPDGTSLGPSGTSSSASESTTTEPPPIIPPPPQNAEWTEISDGVWVTESPGWRDPEWYAEQMGISVEEAEWRNRRSSELNRNSRWFRNRPWFGAFWVEETVDSWWAVIAVTDLEKAQDRVADRLAGTPLFPLVVYREVEYSFLEMEQNLSHLEEYAAGWCLPSLTSTEIDRYGNRVIVGVQDVAEFTAAAAAAEIGLTEFTIDEHQRDPPPERADWCGASDEELASARARWEAHGIDGYVFVASGGSDLGSRGRYQVTVTGGETNAQVLEPGTGAHAGQTWDRGSLDDLYAWATTSWNPAHLEIETHPDWGFITSLYHHVPGAVDEEWWYTIEAFAPAGESPAPTDPAGLPCDYRPDEIAERSTTDDLDLIDRAVRTALGDPALQDALTRIDIISNCHAWRVLPDRPGGGTWVIVNIEPPVDRYEWPLGVCGGERTKIGIVRFTLDADARTIESVCAH